MPDLSGIAYLAVFGLVCAMLCIAAGFPALVYGLAWLSEPRLGAFVWTVWAWSSLLWVVVVVGFVGSIFIPRG